MYTETNTINKIYLKKNNFALNLRVESIILYVIVAFIFVLSIVPLLNLIWVGLFNNGMFDMERLVKLISNSKFITAVINTVIIASASTIVSLILGVSIAWLVEMSDIRNKSLMIFSLVLPFMIPPQITAFSWLQTFSQTGWLFAWINHANSDMFVQSQILYSYSGIIIMLGIYNTPLVFLIVRASLKYFPANLIEAAKINKAYFAYILYSIILPLIRSSIIASAVLAFVSAVGNFGIQAILGIPAHIPTLITLIYQQFNNIGPSALPNMALYSILLGIISFVGFILSDNLQKKKDHMVISEGVTQYKITLGRYRICIELFIYIWIFFVVVLPISSLFITSLLTGIGQTISWEHISLINYKKIIFDYPLIKKAMITSISLSLLTSILLTGISIALAYFISWKANRLAKYIKMIIELTYVLPGIVIGIMVILTYIHKIPILNISIYGTIWMVLFAYLIHFMAIICRTSLTGFSQVERSQYEAAQICGANLWQRVKDVMMPIILPSVLAGTTIVFMTILNEIQVSILLVNSSTQTIGPTILFFDESGSSTLAATIGSLLVILIIALMLCLKLFSKKLPKGIIPWTV